MSSTPPVVSVLVTSHNREEYLGDALQSVLNSSFENFEIVVVDDASTDGSLEVAHAFEKADSRVHVYSNEQNLGDYPNRNKAAHYARGEYLKYLDSDDVLYPHCLEVMVRCMRLFPDAGLGLCAVADPETPFPYLLTPREAYRQHYLEKGLLERAPGSAIILRKAFESTGGFSGRRQVGDHELWLALARSNGIVKMPAGLIWTRQHGAQEKFYQSEAEKAVLHDAVLVEALNAEGCPLSNEEKEAAMNQMHSRRASFYWALVASGSRRKDAGEYRRRAGLHRASLIGFGLRKATQLLLG